MKDRLQIDVLKPKTAVVFVRLRRDPGAYPDEDAGELRWRRVAVCRFAGCQPAIQPITNRRYPRVDHWILVNSILVQRCATQSRIRR